MARRAFHRTTNDRRRRLFVGLLQGALFALLALVVVSVGTFVLFAKDLPDPSRIDERYIPQSTKIYDRTGTVVLYDIYGEEKRTVIPSSEIPTHVKQAAIAIEDQNFYNHPGVDVKAIIRALVSNVTNPGTLQGGSTITQQFIKKSILSDEQTLVRKIKEAILALELERRYSKDEILEFYLNQIPFGSNAYGIEAAAQTYFSKHARDLTIAEGALLAALPQAPTYYSPYGSHIDEMIARKNLVLQRMTEAGYITPEQFEEAKSQELEFRKSYVAINAPHFVFYVRELLEQEYGEEYLSRAGLKIITTIDWELQQKLEDIVKSNAERNMVYGVHNAALVAVDPKTGQILAMVGSRDYFDEPTPEGCTPGVNCRFEPNVNVTVRQRQPGSAIKPIIYATAFKKGYTDQTILFDVPTEFNASCTPNGSPMVGGVACYHPRNFDGQFRGPVTIRQALSGSLNVPAVKTLYLAGIDESIQTARDMGITTFTERDQYGLSLVLGGGAVNLLELTSAFGVFAAEGEYHPPVSILRIEDSDGEIIQEFEDEGKRVLDRMIAREISSILSDNDARRPIFGPNNPLEFLGRDVAVKTGTTDEFRDVWTVGYTPSLALGVWAGNNNYAPSTQPGVTVAAPLWREAVTTAFEELDLPNEPFGEPDLRKGNKPILNGEFIVDGEVHSILHYVNRDDPLGAVPNENDRDPLYRNWETTVRARFGNFGNENSEGGGGRDVRIIEPAGGSNIVPGTAVRIQLVTSTDETVQSADFFFDGSLVGSVVGSGPLYALSFTVPSGISPGAHTITAQVRLKNGGQLSADSVNISVSD